jgi:hypothetical protein
VIVGGHYLAGSAGCSPSTIPFGDGTIIDGGTEPGFNQSDAFDGDTNEPILACWRSPNASSAWIGKDWGAGVTHKITEVVYYGPNDSGVHETDTSVRIRVQESDTGAWGGEEVTIGDTGTFNGSSSGIVKTIACSGGSQKRYHRLLFTGSTSNEKFAAAEIVFKGC